MKNLLALLLIIISGILLSCNKKTEEPATVPSGKVIFSIQHLVNGAPLRENELIYTNEFYYIAHFSKYVKPGARRISVASTKSYPLTTAANPSPTRWSPRCTCSCIITSTPRSATAPSPAAPRLICKPKLAKRHCAPCCRMPMF